MIIKMKGCCNVATIANTWVSFTLWPMDVVLTKDVLFSSSKEQIFYFSIKAIGKITELLLYLITFYIQFRHFFMKAADNDGASLQFLFHYFLHFSHKGSNLAVIFPLHHKSQFEAILQLLLNHITNEMMI